MTAPVITLYGDLTGTAFGAAPTFTDYSSRLELTGDGAPIGVTWGKQDRQSAVQPTTFTFVLDNSDGALTTGAHPITENSIFQVGVTVGGVYYPRATGYVSGADATWASGATTYSLVTVTCVDISGRLQDIATPLHSMLQMTVLADSPTALYPLSESNASGGFANVATPTARTGYVLYSKYGGTVNAGVASLIADEVPALHLQTDGTNNTGAGVVVPNPLGTGAFTVEMMFQADSKTGSTPLQTLFATVRKDGATTFSVGIDGLGDVTAYLQGDGDNTGVGTNVGSATGSVNYRDGQPHHLVVTYTATYPGQYLRMWIDGVEITTPGTYNEIYGGLPALTKQAGATAIAGAILPIAGAIPPIVGSGQYSYGFNGALSMLALYNTALTGTQAATHYQASQGFPGERSDQRYARVAAYAGLTLAALPAGLALMGPQPVQGLGVIDVLTTVAVSEAGVSIVTPDGKLTLQPRTARYWPATAFTVAATPNEDIDRSVTIRFADLASLVNEQTYTRYRGTAQTYRDATSISLRGRKNGGGGQVANATDFDVLQHAAWDVTLGKQGVPRLPNATVDLLTTTLSTAQVQAVLSATVSSMLTVTGVPSQSPTGTSTSQFIEGASEVIGRDVWSITFNTSPAAAAPQTLRADATPDARTKLDSGLKIPL